MKCLFEYGCKMDSGNLLCVKTCGQLVGNTIIFTNNQNGQLQEGDNKKNMCMPANMLTS